MNDVYRYAKTRNSPRGAVRLFLDRSVRIFIPVSLYLPLDGNDGNIHPFAFLRGLHLTYVTNAVAARSSLKELIN